ncbi:hypothetical protein IT072_16715 [Leifsonia sp. ZF2019]|uniref:hypothetical protein n=1 Tax=Leifsonia sp. ZF2019 TaxID=2781978 RepID=UPI001CC11C71|nr:hypothetical protein [Leifsonia sp. ZF2019]UAJ78849.1 hypothetical protein IT072_16715 [Leifsonia sp. ZF2019]
MWNPLGRGYNTLNPDDSADYLDAALQSRIDALTPRQMVELDREMNKLVERTYEQLDQEFTREDEDRYYMQLPPAEIILRDIDPDADLADSIARQVELIPLRWRLDAAMVTSSYISDYGPPQRKYLRTLKRVQREERRRR